MTYAAYTPGPWKLASECDPPDGYVWAPDDDELVAVAQYDCSDLPTLTRAANARLIAAAPDMLDALERAYQKLSFWMDDDKWDHGDEKALELIWAAIAKAKGE